MVSCEVMERVDDDVSSLLETPVSTPRHLHTRQAHLGSEVIFLHCPLLAGRKTIQ